MTREELKELSAKTFFDNNVGGIAPDGHRAFNTAMIDFIPDPTPTATNTSLGTVKGSTAAGKVNIDGNGVMTVNAYMSLATFIIDSNTALAAWSNKTAGNDYSIVVIKPGRWTSAKEVNLTAASTKVVFGLPGNELLFTSPKGLYYDIQPTTTDYFMQGVNLVMNFPDTSEAVLPDTSEGVFSEDIFADPDSIQGFGNVVNLTRCTVSRTINRGIMGAFVSCKNLTTCAVNVPDMARIGIFAGFSQCENLAQCHVEVRAGNPWDNALLVSYLKCCKLTFCSGILIGSSAGQFAPTSWVQHCEDLIGGIFTISGTTRFTACDDCMRMVFCSVSRPNGAASYSGCYMDVAKKQSVGDTAAGGYNREITL